MVFLLDTSGSVSRTNFRQLLDFVGAAIDGLGVSANHTHVGLATFSSRARVAFHLNAFNTSARVKLAVLGAPYRYGDTNTAAGLRTLGEMFSRKRGDREGVPNYGVLVTDGVSNVRAWRTADEARRCRRAGIHLFVVGVALPDRQEALTVASAASSTFLRAGFDELPQVARQLVSAVCEGTGTRKRATPVTKYNEELTHYKYACYR